MRFSLVVDRWLSRTGGGIESYTREFARHVCERGDSVHVVARVWEDDLPVGELPAGCSVTRVVLPAPRGGAALLKPLLYARSLASELRYVDGVLGADLSVSRSVVSAYALGAVHRLGRHVYLPPAVERLRLDARGTPGSFKDRLLRWSWNALSSWMERRVIRRADRVVAFSQNVASQLAQEFGALARKVSVVPPGIDVARFHPGKEPSLRVSLGLAEDEVVALYVGRLSGEKGITQLLEGMAGRSGLPFKLVVVGGGPELARVETLVRSCNGHATVLGPREDVSFLYRAADVFVLPSLYEGFGHVLLEAMASGLPVVARASALPDVRTAAAEVVEDGTEGILVNGRGVEAFLLAIEALARSSSLRREYGERARAKVVASYTWEAHVSRLLACAEG